MSDVLIYAAEGVFGYTLNEQRLREESAKLREMQHSPGPHPAPFDSGFRLGQMAIL